MNNLFITESSTQMYKNGKLVDNREASVKFDGKKIEMKSVNNNKQQECNVKLSKLDKILRQPTSLLTLEQRLKKLCKTKRLKKKSSKKNSSKKKSSKKNSSKKNSSKKNSSKKKSSKKNSSKKNSSKKK